MAEDWNYMVGRMVGDGVIEVIESDLPIDITSIERKLSAPSAMTGSISHALQRLKNNGRPIFEPWNSVIIAVASDTIRGITIYREPVFSGPVWELDQVGLTGYANDMPYTDEKSFVDEDPLDIYRHMWHHLQSFPNGRLGITIDDLASPVRVGTVASEEVPDSGPRRLNPWDTPNIGREIDRYATETPFDWLETYHWEGEIPRCHVRLGYPQIGDRHRGHMRFVLGENLGTKPTVRTAPFLNEVHVLGAGEGRDSVRGFAAVSEAKLRRATVINDDNMNAVWKADLQAQRALAASRGELVVEEIEVVDHPNARLEEIALGNEYPLYADLDWVEVNTWARVIGRVDVPGRSDVARLQIARPGIVV